MPGKFPNGFEFQGQTIKDPNTQIYHCHSTEAVPFVEGHQINGRFENVVGLYCPGSEAPDAEDAVRSGADDVLITSIGSTADHTAIVCCSRGTCECASVNARLHVEHVQSAATVSNESEVTALTDSHGRRLEANTLTV